MGDCQNCVGMDMGKNSSGHMMMMYFHTDIGGDYVLFKSWKPSNGQEMAIACVAVILMTVFYESFKYIREWIHRLQIEKDYNGNSYTNIFYCVQSFLHGIQYFISYSLMLIAMTFQIYLILSILIGAVIGHWIFNHLTEKLHSSSQSQDFSDPCCG